MGSDPSSALLSSGASSFIISCSPFPIYRWCSPLYLWLYCYHGNAQKTPNVLPDTQQILNCYPSCSHYYSQLPTEVSEWLPPGSPPLRPQGVNSGLLGHLAPCPPLAVLGLGGAEEEPVSASGSSCDLPALAFALAWAALLTWASLAGGGRAEGTPPPEGRLQAGWVYRAGRDTGSRIQGPCHQGWWVSYLDTGALWPLVPQTLLFLVPLPQPSSPPVFFSLLFLRPGLYPATLP